MAFPTPSEPMRLVRDHVADPEDLETASARFIFEWMQQRFLGEDPYLPVNDDELELPHRVFVDLWQRAGVRSRLREGIGFGSRDLLRWAWDSQPQPWMRWLLRFVATITPDPCLPFLTGIAKLHHFDDDAREQGLDRLWLEATAAFRNQPPELIPIWRGLMQGQEDYREIAYSALSHDAEMAIRLLPEYFSMIPEGDRALLLREALRDVLVHGFGFVLRRLLWNRRYFLAIIGLPEAVESALTELGYPDTGFGAGVDGDIHRFRQDPYCGIAREAA
jgi:hypothetical protein